MFNVWLDIWLVLLVVVLFSSVKGQLEVKVGLGGGNVVFLGLDQGIWQFHLFTSVLGKQLFLLLGLV